MNQQHSDPSPYAAPEARIQDPGLRGLHLASRGKRLFAQIVNSLVAWGLLVGGVYLVGGWEVLEFDSDSSIEDLLILYIPLLGLAAVNVYLLVTRGQSIGKMLMGIKIVQQDGARAGFGRLIGLRWIVNGLLAVVPLYQLIDPLFIFSSDQQCIHDKIAKTIVVDA